jgi:hypothetical protein
VTVGTTKWVWRCFAGIRPRRMHMTSGTTAGRGRVGGGGVMRVAAGGLVRIWMMVVGAALGSHRGCKVCALRKVCTLPFGTVGTSRCVVGIICGTSRCVGGVRGLVVRGGPRLLCTTVGCKVCALRKVCALPFGTVGTSRCVVGIICGTSRCVGGVRGLVVRGGLRLLCTTVLSSTTTLSSASSSIRMAYGLLFRVTR